MGGEKERRRLYPDSLAHGVGATRIAAAHLWRHSNGTQTPTTPFMITLFYNPSATSPSLAAWPGISAPSAGDGTLPVGMTLPGEPAEHRPAIASLSDAATGDVVHLAWRNSSGSLLTHSCTWPTAASPPQCSGTPATLTLVNVNDPGRAYQHPALAASPSHNNLLLLAYSVGSPTNGNAIGLVRLRENATVTPNLEEKAMLRPAPPRFVALAAHPAGFGLTWVEAVNGADEVFYTFIGCLP